MSEEKQVISVSTGTMIRFVLVLLGVVFVYFFRDLVGALLVSILLAFAISPIADALEKRKIPRSVTVLVVYIVFFSLLGLLILLLVPLVVSEWSDLLHGFGSIWTKVLSGFYSLQSASAHYGFEASFDQSVVAFNSAVSNWFSGLYSTVTGVFSGIISFFIILVVSFFMVAEKNSIRDMAAAVAPKRYHQFIFEIAGKVEKKIGQWLLGQLILMFSVGLISYAGLLIFGVRYALLLAVFSGMLEIIPYVGPVIAAVPAVLFAAVDSPTKAVIVVVLYLLIHRLENMILVPKVMQKTTGLNPIVAILALAVGYSIGGIFGALLAIPTATAVNVIFFDHLERTNR
jgi:predicted PurR-regulated permease PerM